MRGSAHGLFFGKSDVKWGNKVAMDGRNYHVPVRDTLHNDIESYLFELQVGPVWLKVKRKEISKK